MFEIIESYFKDKNFYIIISDNKLFIKNYKKLYELKNDYLLIEINDNVYKIVGKSFSLVKNYNNELEINGSIESIEKI